MLLKFLGILVAFHLCCCVVDTESKLVAMDRIILANMGKEKLMNVHKFDIRLPPFRSDAGEGELDAAARSEARLWTGGVVPYIIEKSILDRPMYKSNLQKAMKEWMKYTCIQFRKKKKGDQDYVVFTYGFGCNADVGRKGNRQYVSLGRGCSDTSVIIHELGHVVGFWHEQNRPDRSKYVDIMWNNIIPDYRFAFDKYTSGRINSRNVTYDYKSIMHYGNYAFSSNRRATIVAKKADVKEFGNIHLSPLDIKQANLVYECPDKASMFPKFPEDFIFSTRKLPKKHCLFMNEPRQRVQQSAWLCHKKTKKTASIFWSHSGKLANKDCTQITSPHGQDRRGLWTDNYLCVENDSVYKFHWSTNKPIRGLGCLAWPSRDAGRRRRAFLCAKFLDSPVDGGWSAWSSWTKCNRGCGGGYQEQRRYCTNPVPKNYGKPCYGLDYKRRFCNLHNCAEFPIWPHDFSFKHLSYTPYEHNCLRIYERKDSLYWRNFYFCSIGTKRRINMKWSSMGKQRGMRCSKIDEPRETGGWDNNYLCVPANSDYRFRWSHSGPIRGLACVRWFARNGSRGWNDNYLCGKQLKRERSTRRSLQSFGFRVNGPVHGGWSEWSTWSQCSKTCDQGYQRRTRTCTEPTPSQDGRRCSGSRIERRRCAVKDCFKSCKGVYKASKGTLTSPQFPKYPRNVRCRWKILAPAGKKIELKFTYLRLQDNRSRCSINHLIVRDGDASRARILKLFCDDIKSSLILQSSGNKMTLQLRTSSFLQTGGFRAEWKAKDIQKKGHCGGNLAGRSGAITSPLYPTKYPNDVQCTWVISVDLDRLLQVKFQDFSVEKHSKCSYDKLEVYDGGTLMSPKRTYCGKKNPGTITAFTNKLLIKFKSDASRNYRGFKLSWSTKKRLISP